MLPVYKQKNGLHFLDPTPSAYHAAKIFSEKCFNCFSIYKGPYGQKNSNFVCGYIGLPEKKYPRFLKKSLKFTEALGLCRKTRFFHIFEKRKISGQTAMSFFLRLLLKGLRKGHSYIYMGCMLSAYPI